MKYQLLLIFLCILSNLFDNITSTSLELDLKFEYPYTCGTWFNRGKNTCNAIIKILEENNLKVNSSIKPFHKGDIFPQGYNGEFNIYLKKGDQEILIATSLENSKYYHPGLKYFAYTYYMIDEKNGEKNYLEEFPQKKEMLKYILERTVKVLGSNNLRIN